MFSGIMELQVVWCRIGAIALVMRLHVISQRNVYAFNTVDPDICSCICGQQVPSEKTLDQQEER